MAVLGLFAGAAVWTIAGALAADRPLRAYGRRTMWAAALPVAVKLPLARLGWSGQPTEDRAAVRPLVEAAIAVYFGVAAGNHGASLDLAATLVFAVPLLLILLVDWWTRYIYTGVVIIGIVAGLAFALARGLGVLIGSVLAALLAGLVFAVGYVVAGILFGSGEGEEPPFGLGDVYLAVMIGAMAGFPGVIRALLTGAFLAAAVGLLLLARRRDRHDAIPYGSYLCLGTLLSMVLPA